MNTQLASEQLKKLVELFSKQEFPKVAGYKFISAPEKPSSRWSLMNNLIMYLSGTDDARTFNQWNFVYRHVKKGCKAIYILAPTMGKFKLDELDEDGQPKVIERLVGFHALPVFRIEDTDGQPLEVYKPKTLPPLLDVAAKWGCQVRYERLASEYGHFSQRKNEIVLGSEDMVVFLHELSHKAHQLIDGKLEGGQDAKQECIAQLSACVLASMYGFDYKNETWQYIASYSESHTPEAVGRLCFSVLAKVQQVIEKILS